MMAGKRRNRKKISNVNVKNTSITSNNTEIRNTTIYNFYNQHKQEITISGIIVIFTTVIGIWSDIQSISDNTNKDVITRINEFEKGIVLKIGENKQELFGEDLSELSKAKAYINDDKFDIAIEILKKILIDSPDSFEVNYLLGLIYYNKNEMGESLTYFRIAHLNYKYSQKGLFDFKIDSILGLELLSVQKTGKELLNLNEKFENPLLYMIYAWGFATGHFSGEHFLSKNSECSEPLFGFIIIDQFTYIVDYIIIFNPSFSYLLYSKDIYNTDFGNFISTGEKNFGVFNKPKFYGHYTVPINEKFYTLPITITENTENILNIPIEELFNKGSNNGQTIEITGYEFYFSNNDFSLPLKDGLSPQKNITSYFANEETYLLLKKYIDTSSIDDAILVVNSTKDHIIPIWAKHYILGYLFRIKNDLKESSKHFFFAHEIDTGSFQNIYSNYINHDSWKEFDTTLNNYWPLYQICINYYLFSNKDNATNLFIKYNVKFSSDPNIEKVFSDKPNYNSFPSVIKQATFTPSIGKIMLLPDEIETLEKWIFEDEQ